MTLAILLLGSFSVFAKSLDEGRAELQDEREWTLGKLYEEIP